MLTILEGQISFGGIQDALEIVSRHKDVKNGMLKLTSQDTSGTIGVFCGRFITGARLTLTEEMGYEALRTLLSVKDGNFAFFDVGAEQLIELRQSLAVDIHLLLQSRDFADGVPLSSESLTGMSMAATHEQVQLIDTAAEYSLDDFAERLMPTALDQPVPRDYQEIEQVEAERSLATDFDEITMDRVPPHHEASRVPIVTDSYDGAPNDSGVFRRRPSESPRPIVIPVDDEIPPPKMVPEAAGQSADDFKRTRDWSQKSSQYRKVGLAALAIAIIAGCAFVIPKLGKIGGITGSTTVGTPGHPKQTKPPRHTKHK